MPHGLGSVKFCVRLMMSERKFKALTKVALCVKGYGSSF